MTKKKKVNPSEVGGATNDYYKQVDDYEVSAYNLVYDRMAKAKVVNDSLKFQMKKWQDMAYSRLDMSAIDSTGSLINQQHQTRVCLPIVQNGIRALLSKYIVAMLLRRPFFNIVPMGIMDDEAAKRIESALIYMFDKMPNFVQTMITLIQEMLIFGTAIGKVTWKKQLRNTKAGEVIEYEGAYVEPIHLENFFIDPEATSLNGFWKTHRYWKTNKELRTTNEKYKKLTGKDLYKNMDMIGPGETGYTRKDDGTFTIQWDKAARGVYTAYERLNEYFVNEIWEYWSEDNSRLILVANKRIVIYDGPNPHDSGMHPFIMATYEPVPFEFYGMGACEKVRDMHTLLQSVTNQIASNIRLHSSPGYWTEPNNVSQTQVIARDGKISFCADITKIKDKPFQPLGPDVYQLQSQLITKIEQTLGSNTPSSAVGTPVTKEQTATESAINNRLGNEFHSFNLLLLEVPMLVEIVKRAYMLLQQFAGEEYEYRITEEKGPGYIHKDDLQDVHFTPRIGVDLMSAEVKVATISNLMQSLAQIPGLSAELIPTLMDEAGKMLGIHFKTNSNPQSVPTQNAPQTPPMAPQGPNTGVPGALQMPEQMNQMPRMQGLPRANEQ